MESKRLTPIIVTTDLNDAEELISAIRNSGYAVHSSVASSRETLYEQLGSVTADLILFDTEKAGFKLEELHKMVKEAGRHLPTIALVHKPVIDPTPLLDLGIEDVVALPHLDHLQHVVKRTAVAQGNWRALKNAEAQFRESEKRCQLLLESSKDAISYVHEGMHIYANRSYLDLFGIGEMEEIEGVPLMDLVTQEERAHMKDFLRQYTRGNEPEQTLSTSLLTISGEEFEAELDFSPASIEGENCTQILIHQRDGNTEELEKQIHFFRQRDLMTGLYNRQYFMDKLKEAVSGAARGLGNRAVIMLSLDRFEPLKETLGISGSDLLLVEISKVLEQTVDSEDIACRFDGNRFIILSSQWKGDALQTYMDRLKARISNHICELDGRSVSSPASLGASVIDENVPDANEVIGRVERAFLQAVKAGGDQAVVYRPQEGEMTQKQLDELWSKRLRDAIKTNRMRLFFQPIINLNEEEGQSYNVMMRMLDENNEPVPAQEFMVSAERTGVAKMLDRWVLHHALLKLSTRLRENKQTTLFIKLSTTSLQNIEILQWLSAQMKETRVPGNHLVFEVKTGDAINYLKQVHNFHKGLRQLHCRLSLDGFGVGANPLQLLKQIPAEVLKFDSSFMDNLTGSPENQETIKTLTEHAHASNRTVIVQNVEDSVVLPILYSLGINFVQGNFLQAPLEEMN